MRLGRVADEDDLARRRRVHERAHLLARTLERRRRALGELVDAAVHVGVRRRVEVGHRLEHLARLLRAAAESRKASGLPWISCSKIGKSARIARASSFGVVVTAIGSIVSTCKFPARAGSYFRGTMQTFEERTTITGPLADTEDARLTDFQCVFRELNEEMVRIARALPGAEPPAFACECSDPACLAPLKLGFADYDAVRVHPDRFIVVPGDERPEWDRVVERGAGWASVEKTSPTGRAIASERSPRPTT